MNKDPQHIHVEYEVLTSGPTGTLFKVYTPYNEAEYHINNQDCAIMRRNQEEVLEQRILEDIRPQFPEVEHITLLRR
jgi:hypothetical protein